MSILAKIAELFRPKSSRKKHDGGAPSSGQLTLSDARSKQQAAVQKMRRGVADVSVSRQRLDLQADDLQKAMERLTQQAQKSRSEGDETSAQSAMNRHLIMGGQLSDLVSQRDALAEQETMLISALTQLQARAAGFNVTVETLTATQKAAVANQDIAQALEEFNEGH
ncbi:PspA/IM30 family protein [Arthrobacter sp. Sr24]